MRVQIPPPAPFADPMAQAPWDSVPQAPKVSRSATHDSTRLAAVLAGSLTVHAVGDRCDGAGSGCELRESGDHPQYRVGFESDRARTAGRGAAAERLAGAGAVSAQQGENIPPKAYEYLRRTRPGVTTFEIEPVAPGDAADGPAPNRPGRPSGATGGNAWSILDKIVEVRTIEVCCGVEQWQLVGLITQRPQVRIQPPLPENLSGLRSLAGLFMIRRRSSVAEQAAHNRWVLSSSLSVAMSPVFGVQGHTQNPCA